MNPEPKDLPVYLHHRLLCHCITSCHAIMWYFPLICYFCIQVLLNYLIDPGCMNVFITQSCHYRLKQAQRKLVKQVKIIEQICSRARFSDSKFRFSPILLQLCALGNTSSNFKVFLHLPQMYYNIQRFFNLYKSCNILCSLPLESEIIQHS